MNKDYWTKRGLEKSSNVRHFYDRHNLKKRKLMTRAAQ